LRARVAAAERAAATGHRGDLDLAGERAIISRNTELQESLLRTNKALEAAHNELAALRLSKLGSEFSADSVREGDIYGSVRGGSGLSTSRWNEFTTR
jgi:hypothetical protein